MLKTIAQAVGSVFALPLFIRFALLKHLIDSEQALSAVSEAAARHPGLLGIYTRQALYSRILAHTGSDIHFGYQTLVSKPTASIADGVYLGRFCTIGWVEIAENARLADGVQLLSGSHHHGSGEQGVQLNESNHQPIRIGRGAWIGANAVVMADVGAGAIVGAGAVVTRPVPAGVTVAGVPAKPISTSLEQPKHAA